MLCSLNEVEQIARKAAKGNGLPWGVADEVAKSVRWLQAFGIDAISPFETVLRQLDHNHAQQYSSQTLNGIWQAPSKTLSPLLVGVSLSDCLGLLKVQRIVTAEIRYPILAAGFLGQAALRKRDALEIGWDDVVLKLYRNEMIVSGDMAKLTAAKAKSLYCQACSDMTFNNAKSQQMELHVGDTEVNAQAYQQLEVAVFKTYVEATEESRLHGAGAGLNDND